ncbi:hypothetical protein KQX54_018208 [Cotesia glomerata]|uniref:Uncharacterized protein n=1 Tax=Cotesia glomerata TaxID=32391 RepID=A0AAV7I3Z3_COTGL|nr:hypothetical protein KQX54_018208 [Cotesia glomerata]
MLKGNILSHLDTHNEEESSYVTLSNGPYVGPSNSETDKFRHNLVDVYFVTPILCVQCEDYIWGTGKVGVKCSDVIMIKNLNKVYKDNHKDTSSVILSVLAIV